VTARVEQDSAGYRAVIEIRAGDVGTVRELSSPSCETLLDVTTLLSAAIAQDATARSSPVADVTEPLVPPSGPGAAAAAFVPPPTAASDPPRSGEDDVARA